MGIDPARLKGIVVRRYVPDPEASIVHTESLDMGCLRWGESGPLVILVHGFPDTARTWDLIGPRIAAEGYRVVAPFTRGYAPTQPGRDGKYDSDTLGMDLIHLVEALEEDSAILVGHDWGASAVYTASALRPERVRKMATLAIPHPAGIKPRLSLLWGVRHFAVFKLPGAAKRFARNDFAALHELYRRWSPSHDWPASEMESAKNAFSAPGCLDAAIEYYRQLRPSTPGLRRKISVPALVVGGLSDGVTTAADYEASRGRFTGDVNVAMVPGGHFLHREHPEALLDVLLPWLSRASTRSGPEPTDSSQS